MEEQLSNIYETLRKQRVERFKDLDDNNPRKKSTIEGSTLKKYGSVIKTMAVRPLHKILTYNNDKDVCIEFSYHYHYKNHHHN